MSERLLANRYALQERLEYGGVGQVFRAQDLVLDRFVAVKLLSDWPEEASATATLVAEARLVAPLDHPGAVRVLDAGMSDGYGYLVLELVEGPTLSDLLRQRGSLTEAETVSIALDVADVLDAAHSRGMVHGAVRPSTIVLAANGHAKLLDFGIARAITATRTFRTSELAGSLPYIAPEQLSSSQTDPRSDIYALAAVTYEMLAGRPPAPSGAPESSPPPRRSDPNLGAELDAVIMRGLHPRPEQRFPTAAAFHNALQRLRSASDAVTPVGTEQTMRIDRARLESEQQPSRERPTRPAPSRPQRWARTHGHSQLAGIVAAGVLVAGVLLGASHASGSGQPAARAQDTPPEPAATAAPATPTTAPTPIPTAIPARVLPAGPPQHAETKTRGRGHGR